MRKWFVFVVLLIVALLDTGCASGPMILGGEGISVHVDRGKYIISLDMQAGDGIIPAKEHGGTVSVSLKEDDIAEEDATEETPLNVKRVATQKWLAARKAQAQAEAN